MAAESVDVKVIGTITPAACTPTLSGGGTIDYGAIKANTVQTDDYTVLEDKSVSMSIACEAPTKVSISAVNGRPGTAAGASTPDTSDMGAPPPVRIYGSNWVVGLGTDSDKNIGGYALYLTSLTTDGAAAHCVYRNTDWAAGTWGDSSSCSIYANANIGRSLSWGNAESNAPVSFTNATAEVHAKAYLNKGSELDLSHDIQLDGLSTIELTYL
nr:DUF1120 domain-containing protein [Cedecea sulfonylureivorans]